MSLLFFVVIIVSWILFFVLKNYFWGNFIFFRGFFFRGFFQIDFFFKNQFSAFQLFFFRFFLCFFYIFIYNIIYFFNIFLNNSLKSKDFFSNSNIVNFFINKSSQKNLWKVWFLFVGNFCFHRGFYLCSNFFTKKNLFNNSDNVTFFKNLKAKQELESFVFGHSISRSEVIKDTKEKPFQVQKFVHSFKLELFWAIFPTLKCLTILVPSLILLYSSAALKFYDHIQHVTANQWYWNYSSTNVVSTNFTSNTFLAFPRKSFLDNYATLMSANKFFPNIYPESYNNRLIAYFLSSFDGRMNISSKDDLRFNLNSFASFYDTMDLVIESNFDSFMIADNELLPFQQRVLETDVHLVLPCLRSTKLLINAADVLHSFVILSTGVKVDAIVGRINEMTIFILRSGLFFGQCSELCGSGHFGMPIVVEALNPFDFESYLLDKYWLNISDNTMVPYVPSSFNIFSLFVNNFDLWVSTINYVLIDTMEVEVRNFIANRIFVETFLSHFYDICEYNKHSIGSAMHQVNINELKFQMLMFSPLKETVITVDGCIGLAEALNQSSKNMYGTEDLKVLVDFLKLLKKNDNI